MDKNIFKKYLKYKKMYIELKKGGKGTKKEGETCTWQAIGSQCQSGSCYNGKCCSKGEDYSVIGNFLLLKNYVALDNYFIRFTERIKNFLDEYKKSDSIHPKFLTEYLKDKSADKTTQLYETIDQILTNYLNLADSDKKQKLNEIIDRIQDIGMYAHPKLENIPNEIMNYLVKEEGIRITKEVAKEQCCSQKATLFIHTYPLDTKRRNYSNRHDKPVDFECIP